MKKETGVKNQLARHFGMGAMIALVLSLSLATAIAALPSLVPFTPLYPPGPPYSRLGPGGAAPNFWSASGQGNPQFFMSGGLFWWQNPPQQAPG